MESAINVGGDGRAGQWSRGFGHKMRRGGGLRRL
jgi:hypothetical protein